MRYQIDFGQVLKNLDGRPLRAGAVAPEVIEKLQALTVDFEEERLAKLNEGLAEYFGEPQTLAKVCVGALLGHHDEEKKIGADEQVRRFELARRLNRGGTQEYNEKERDLLKKVVGMGYRGNLIAPMVWELLEGAERVTELQAVKA